MRTSMILGLALGALIGAALVEGNSPVSEMVSKGKQKIKDKINQINASMN
ncbi:MAG TPA: hypothetical protein GX745_00590 [Clostridiales bacterium]|jgi:hypothetical protein|nr:hypothetical protein [Clostridiales bacterium]